MNGFQNNWSSLDKIFHILQVNSTLFVVNMKVIVLMSCLGLSHKNPYIPVQSGQSIFDIMQVMVSCGVQRYADNIKCLILRRKYN